MAPAARLSNVTPLFRFRDLPDSGALVDEQGRVVCDRCVVAKRPLKRMRGLLGRKPPEPGQGLLFPGTRSVHTYFMSFPIDIVFLDRDLRVDAVVPDVKPFKLAAHRGSRSVLELRAGDAARVGLREGAQLEWARSESSSARPKD